MIECDYCGQEILGPPISVNIQPDDLEMETSLPAGDYNFCSQECLNAYMEEAGIPPMNEEESDLWDEAEDPYQDMLGRPMI